MEELIRRIQALEVRARNSDAIGKDFRVIEMQLARAEDKVLRLARDCSWTRPEPLRMTEKSA